jgi:hypothetical protein
MGSYNKPLCTGNTQTSAKAYPGQREISVLHDYAVSAPVAGNSIVASICPANLTAGQETSAGYGYNPAAQALVNQLKDKLKGSCLPKPLGVDSSTKQVSCNLVEVVAGHTSDCASYCVGQGRASPAASTLTDVTVAMQQSGICGGAGQPTCSGMCACLLPQASGAALAICQSGNYSEVTNIPPSYCYVDPAMGAGSGSVATQLVSHCPATQRQVLRFTGGTNVPLQGSQQFLSCSGQPQ